MSPKRIVVIGSNFAGATAAIELKRLVGERHRVTVISRTHEFLFTPSLALVAFGLRSRAELTFSLRAPFARHGIKFREEEVTQLDLERRRVLTRTGEERYDFLVIATGPRANYAAVPGLGPRGYTHSIVSLAEAKRAGLAFERVLKSPGPVIIGELSGANSFGAARDFLVEATRRLTAHGLDVPVSWLSAHAVPPGDDLRSVTAVTGALRRVSPEELSLADGRRLPFAYAMIIPPAVGVDVVRACESITNAAGFVLVDDRLRCERYPEVFAAGTAAALSPSAPPSAQLAEEMGRVVAQNIAAALEGHALSALTRTGLAPLDAGAEARWAQLAFKRYFAGA